MKRGQVLVFFAVVLPAVLLPLAALAAETGLLAERKARLSEAAAVAATTAALALDTAALRAGTGWTLDAGAARMAASQALAVDDPSAVLDSVEVDGSRVAVRAHEVVHLQLAVFTPRAGITLHAGALASLAAGYSAPG